MSLNVVNLSKVTCNQVGHQEKFIEILCLVPECKESATLCSKCLVNTHLECRKSVQDQEAILSQLMGLKQLSLDIEVLQQQVNQYFKELVGLIEQTLLPISKYQTQPNLTNLNEIAFLLKKSPIQIINHSIERTKFQIRLLLDNHSQKQENKQEEGQIQIQKELENSHLEARVFYSKGEALYQQEKYNDAITCYDKAIATNSNCYLYYYSKGLAIYQLKKYSEAIDCYEKAIAIDPNHTICWLNYGEALYQCEKYSDSIACYEKAIAIDPKVHINWYSKGLALVEIGRLDDAIKYLKKETELNPTSIYFQNKLEEARQKLRNQK